MKARIVSVWLFLLVFAYSFSSRSADFVNLGFEAADLSRLETSIYNSIQVKSGSLEEMLPGWTVLQEGGSYRGRVFLNERLDDSIGLYQSNAGVLARDYSLTYEQHFFDPRNYIPKLQLIQVGTIPIDAWELHAYRFPPPLSINGEMIPARELPGFRLYAYDVRQYAGKEVTLEIRNYVNPIQKGGLEFDILGFATPEPSEWVLLVGGAAALFGWKWWSDHSRSV